MNLLGLLLGIGGATVLWKIFGKNVKAYLKNSKKDKPKQEKPEKYKPVKQKTEKTKPVKEISIKTGRSIVINDDDNVIQLSPEIKSSNNNSQ